MEEEFPFLSTLEDRVRISLRVHPKAKKEGPGNVIGGALRWSVNAPAEQGKANSALVKSIAKFFRVSKGQVSIVFGETSRTKLLEIKGLSLKDAIIRLREVIVDS